MTSPRKKAHAKIEHLHMHNTKTPDAKSRIKDYIRAKTPAVDPLFKNEVVTANGPMFFKGNLPKELSDIYYAKSFIGKGASG